MKKIILLAAACAALAACNLIDAEKQMPEVQEAKFKKGQEVTLSVNSGDKTKVSSVLDDNDSYINFNWEEGDKLLVTMGQKSSEFTLVGKGGSRKGEFKGTMPDDGDKYDVQYPVSTPDLSTQDWEDEALPHNKMLFKAENCTGNTIELEAQYSVLRLNLWAYTAIGSIEVTNKTSGTSKYTLNCKSKSTSGVINDDINIEEPFFIVVEPGEWAFEAKVYGVAAEPYLICTRAPKDDKKTNFELGTIIDFSAKTSSYAKLDTDLEPVTIGGVTWAPVNCGYDPEEGYWNGQFYQWARKYGQANTGVVDAKVPNFTSDTDGNTADDKDYFFEKKECWYTECESSDDWASSLDPCPEGWCVPTQDQLNALKNDKGSVWDDVNKGLRNGSLFLPACGSRDFHDSIVYDTEQGFYWSSEAYSDKKAKYLNFIATSGAVEPSDFRSAGCSVRCVKKSE